MNIPRPNPAGRFDPAALFAPTSVAVIGDAAGFGARIHANLTTGGFAGHIQAVDAVAQLDQPPQLAVLALPPEAIGSAMHELAAKGCFCAIVPGAADGLPALAARTGVRVLGPHAFGVAVPALGLNASLAHIAPPPGHLALVSQSGALCRAVIDWAGPNGVGFSHIVGLGGNVDLGFGAALDWLSRDPAARTILLDIRRIKDARRFLSAARAAARLRPVVALCAGQRLRDPRDGTARIWEAALGRAGVLYVNTLEDLLAAAETLARARPARGEALAIVGNAIGPAQLAADAALDKGLPLAVPNGFAMAAPGALAAAAARLAQAPETGGVLVCHAPAASPDADTLTGLAEAGRAAPILVCAMGETTGALLRRAITDAGLPVFPMPVQAVAGFHHLVRDRRNRAAARELPTSKVLPIAPDKATVGRLFDTARRDNRLSLMQDEALDVLAAYGVPIVPTRRIESPDDAAVAAALLGFPAVVKLRQAVPPQERARGGLALDLPDAVSCAVAARVVVARTHRDVPDAHTLLVQRQAARAEEFTVHVADDPTFGPVIGVNLRGVADSARHEPALDLPPLNLALARALIGRGAVGQSVVRSTARDRPPVDPAALAETLVRISQLLVDFPDIAELRVSSLFADDQGAIAADAWLRLRAAGESAAPLAIAPYPVELEEEWKLGEEKLIVRPIRPEDAEAHAVLFNRLSPQDIRFRFFAALRSLSPEQMARLTQVDYDREMAFIAVNPATGETLGVARLVSDVEQRIGEFAVIVRPDMKGRGLATHLMQRLIAWARLRRLTEITGQVLSENAPMLAFVRNMGFTVARMPDEPEVMEVRLPL